MSKVDQFESAFRRSAKAVFRHERKSFASVLVVTDLAAYEARQLLDRARSFLAVLESDDPTWSVVTGDEFVSARDVLGLVEQAKPDLIVTYRHLHADWRSPFSLGDHLVVLTQATTTPVLVLPPPSDDSALDDVGEDTNAVMALTDHLTGDDDLVNTAIRFTADDGTLWLAHVEDDATFARYMDVIGKIQEIDTDLARDRIGRQLVREPTDYIDSCRRAVTAAGLPLTVEAAVLMGHRLAECRRIIEEQTIDLLVMNTKDDDQLAMHGLAHPLAVDLHRTPLLLL